MITNQPDTTDTRPQPPKHYLLSLPLALKRIEELEGENARLRETLFLETSMPQGDGTDVLLTALYGESSAATIGKAIGGSQAKMLHDAAAEITKLRGIIDSLAARCQQQSDLLTARAEKIQERIEQVQDDQDYTGEED